MVQKSQTTTCDVYKTLVNNGRNYQPQLVSRISSIDSIFHLDLGWNKSSHIYCQRFFILQLFASALVKAEDVSPEVVAKALRFMYTGSVKWENDCFQTLLELWPRSSFGQSDGIWLRWSDWNHVESRVKEVIQWSNIWSKHACIKKMSSFPVFLPQQKSLAFWKDLVDQKDQQKPTKPRWSCRWCGYWVFGICTQVRHYRWAWNFGEEEVKADWNCLKVSWDTGKDMWWHDKSMFDLKKIQVSFECSMPWETLGLLLT